MWYAHDGAISGPVKWIMIRVGWKRHSTGICRKFIEVTRARTARLERERLKRCLIKP